MLVRPTVPALLLGFVLQAVCAFAAALGVWRGQRWAAGAVVLLGVCMAGTWLFEGFILGIVAYLYALAIAVIALIVTLVTTAYVNRQRWISVPSGTRKCNKVNAFGGVPRTPCRPRTLVYNHFPRIVVRPREDAPPGGAHSRVVVAVE
jgi:hypothetical protein